MNYPTFTPGQLFESKTHGTVEFRHMDHYMGETTYCFWSISNGDACNWKPESLRDHLNLPSEADRITELERQSAELVEAVSVPELRNIMGVHMLGDFVVQVEFPSCRSAEAFKLAITNAIAKRDLPTATAAPHQQTLVCDKQSDEKGNE